MPRLTSFPHLQRAAPLCRKGIDSLLLPLAHNVGGKQVSTADGVSGNLGFMTSSSVADVNPKAAALAISEMVRMTVPRLKELADAYLPQLQDRLWQDTEMPDVVTWTLLHERQVELLRQSANDLVARDVEIAAERGTPWPSGSSIRRETAVRVGITSSLVEKAGRVEKKSITDGMLFRDGADTPARFSLGDLIQATAAVLLRLSRAICERDPVMATTEIARVLGRIFGELMVSMVGLFHLVEDIEAADAAQKMVGFTRPLVDLLGDGSEPSY